MDENQGNDWLTQISSIDRNKDHLKFLGDQLRSSQKVIPFVGAGLSKPFGYPTWREFLSQEATRAGIYPQIQSRLRQAEYVEAAQDLLTACGRMDFDDTIRITYGSRQQQDFKLLAAASKLPSLTAGPVITTNFDKVLETVFEIAGKPFQRVVWGAKVSSITQALTGDRSYLIKLHGDAEEVTDRILTAEEYRHHYGDINSAHIDDHKPLPEILERIFSNRPVLFLGCSLGQDHTMQILMKVAKKSGPSHYAIVEHPPLKKLDFRRRRAFLSEHNIRPVWYPRGEHKYVSLLLGYLVKFTNPQGYYLYDSDIPKFASSLGVSAERVQEELAKLPNPRVVVDLSNYPNLPLVDTSDNETERK